jgi:peptidoglycan/LPS O-acetylase OafA/YrhL
VTIGIAALAPDKNHPLVRSVGFTFIDLACAGLLARVLSASGGSAVQWLRSRPLVYTGKRAYGLYLLHVPASWIGRDMIAAVTGNPIESHSLAGLVLMLVGSYSAAALSWKLVEAPALAIRDRFVGDDHRRPALVDVPQG